MQKKELQTLPCVSPTGFVFSNSKWNNMENKRQISCSSINVVYFLSCNSCEGASNSTIYIGQTTNLRNRMNNHISECRTGKSSCNFPKHVFECAKANNSLKEPFFKVLVFMALTDAKLLYCTMKASYSKLDMTLSTHDSYQNDFIFRHRIPSLIFGHIPMSNSHTTAYLNIVSLSF